MPDDDYSEFDLAEVEAAMNAPLDLREPVTIDWSYSHKLELIIERLEDAAKPLSEEQCKAFVFELDEILVHMTRARYQQHNAPKQ